MYYVHVYLFCDSSFKQADESLNVVGWSLFCSLVGLYMGLL